MCTCNIDEIMDMLDWKNSIEVQEKGVELGCKVRCINVFQQPGHPGHCKNVWDNCAKILSQKSDETLKPYIYNLLEWLEDSNWPGAGIIFERLMKYNNVQHLAYWVEECARMADATKNRLWQINLAALLEYEQLVNHLSNDVIEMLRTAHFDEDDGE